MWVNLRDEKQKSRPKAFLLGQETILRCHPAWRKESAHLRILIYADFFYGEPYSVAHTEGGSPSFRLPSEVHSAKCFLPRSHRPRLSVRKGKTLTYSSSSV